MIDFSKFNSLISVINFFDTEAKCKEVLYENKWADGEAVCPFCGHTHTYLRSNGRIQCAHCKKTFSVTVGTIFENTKIQLRKWFCAMYLVSSHKKGISSHQLARDLEVTQKTAWFMLQKIRTLFAQDDTEALSGIVECDEVYIGGKEKWKHKSMRTEGTQGRSTKTKTPVFGMMERIEVYNPLTEEVEPMTIVKAVVVEKTDRETLEGIIGQFVAEGSLVITDELNSYAHLEEMGYAHSVVCHSNAEFADGSIFTNSMEGFWGHFRRMILGIYHDVSDKYLQRYVDESCFRWNTRKQTEGERFATMFARSLCIVRYDDIKSCAA